MIKIINVEKLILTNKSILANINALLRLSMTRVSSYATFIAP